MADENTDRIIRNITKLISSGAKEPDVSGYLASENVTPQQLGLENEVVFKQQVNDAVKVNLLKTQSAIPGKVGEVATSVGQILPSEETIDSAVSTVGNIAKESALPTGLGLAGSAAASALALSNPASAPFVGAAATAGESVGSLAGEGLNQLFGITERSNAQLFLAAGLPSVAKGLSSIGKGAVKRFSGAARELQEEAIEKLAGKANLDELITNPLPLDFKPDTGSILADIIPEGSDSSEKLFLQLAEINPPIKTINTKKAIAGLQKEILKTDVSLQDESVNKIVNGLQKRVSETGFVDLDNIQADLRALKGKLGTDRNVNRQIGGIIKGFDDDLLLAEKEIGGPVGSLLKKANKVFARERFQENVVQTSSDFIKQGKGLDDPVSINLPAIIERVRKSKLFEISRKAVPKDVDDFIKTVSLLSRRTPARIKATQPLRNLIVGSAVGTVATAATGNPTVGIAIGTANVLVPFITAKFLATRAGRALLRSAVKKGPLTGKSLMIALQAARKTETGKELIRQVSGIVKEAEQNIKTPEPSRQPPSSQNPPNPSLGSF